MTNANRENILTPIGRLVQGSLYEGQTTDAEGRPLISKTGANQGQPRVNFYFAIAIPKGLEGDWRQTSWGQKLLNVGLKGFPQGQTNSPSFAWKVVDGDSQVPNKKGRKPCDREGYPAHWILNFSSSIAPNICNANGTQQILEKDAVKLGDYIQVYGSVVDNESMQQPGVFLNHQYVAFAGYGERIVLGIDPKDIGFGADPLPAGASLTPIESGFNPAPAQKMPLPPAYPEILTPPVPLSAPKRTLTPKSNGATYEQLLAAGWTDDLLIQHGMMS